MAKWVSMQTSVRPRRFLWWWYWQWSAHLDAGFDSGIAWSEESALRKVNRAVCRLADLQGLEYRP